MLSAEVICVLELQRLLASIARECHNAGERLHCLRDNNDRDVNFSLKFTVRQPIRGQQFKPDDLLWYKPWLSPEQRNMNGGVWSSNYLGGAYRKTLPALDLNLWSWGNAAEMKSEWHILTPECELKELAEEKYNSCMLICIRAHYVVQLALLVRWNTWYLVSFTWWWDWHSRWTRWQRSWESGSELTGKDLNWSGLSTQGFSDWGSNERTREYPGWAPRNWSQAGGRRGWQPDREGEASDNLAIIKANMPEASPGCSPGLSLDPQHRQVALMMARSSLASPLRSGRQSRRRPAWLQSH